LVRSAQRGIYQEFFFSHPNQNWQVGLSLLLRRKESLISLSTLRRIARERRCARQSEMRKRVDSAEVIHKHNISPLPIYLREEEPAPVGRQGDACGENRPVERGEFGRLAGRKAEEFDDRFLSLAVTHGNREAITPAPFQITHALSSWTRAIPQPSSFAAMRAAQTAIWRER